jgi:hypothetical protein
MEYPRINKAYYMQTYERGDIVLRVEIEGYKPMTFYPDAVKGIALEEGTIPSIFGNREYDYEYKFGEPIPGSKYGFEGPATKHPGLVRVLRRYFDDRLRGQYAPGTDITEEATKEDSGSWFAPMNRR